jgi:biopolymer transport protein ExbD
MSEHNQYSTVPTINVTPLIDVLLVLLIIFMVASPLRPHKFEAQVPSVPDDRELPPNIHTLVVTVNPDRTLKLNGLTEMGTIDDLSAINSKLVSLFEERTKNRAFRPGMELRLDLSDKQRIEKTVFIKAPRNFAYGDIAKLIDGLKGTGAAPIGLQLDGLQ